jgi:hypothetical protein
MGFAGSEWKPRKPARPPARRAPTRRWRGTEQDGACTPCSLRPAAEVGRLAGTAPVLATVGAVDTARHTAVVPDLCVKFIRETEAELRKLILRTRAKSRADPSARLLRPSSKRRRKSRAAAGRWRARWPDRRPRIGHDVHPIRRYLQSPSHAHPNLRSPRRHEIRPPRARRREASPTPRRQSPRGRRQRPRRHRGAVGPRCDSSAPR